MSDDSTISNVVDINANSRVLTAHDIFTGGDNPYTSVEIPSIVKNGRPGIVYLKPISARDALKFTAVKDEDRNEYLFVLLSKSMVDADGNLIFKDVNVSDIGDKIPLNVFNYLALSLLKVMGMSVDPSDLSANADKATPEGEGLSGADTISASHID